ncbi:SDR family oxidoreductase [Pontibacter silvestris]|uniref:SDR family oxidoreductase n=1 Tax=Pontibacter silvestris TaxID=2305183 RepID=A0ABW4WYW8_9BACT|nr:SDR family oxidoreductase [Pontibacter silvestris]MCC9135518.1 SDR family oxidoreductase [Pontibacter silvestris]
MHHLKDRKAVISGGGAGIGQAVASSLAAQGVRTAVADVQLPEIMQENIHAFKCDVSSGPSIDSLFANVQESIGSPDMLICCAGRGIHEKLTEGDPEKWRQIIDVNLMGALRMVRAFVPGMLEAGFGDVVFISSVSAGQAYPYGGIYAATKSALEIVAETLRQEVLPTVRVSVVAPGVTNTAFFENTVSGSQSVESIGYGFISPEEVAEAVLYALARPKGVSVNYMTVRPTGQPF